MNAVQWLRGRPEMVGIESKTHESLIFAADPGLRLRLVIVPTLLAIVVIIGLGATTYLARRDWRRGGGGGASLVGLVAL